MLTYICMCAHWYLLTTIVILPLQQCQRHMLDSWRGRDHVYSKNAKQHREDLMYQRQKSAFGQCSRQYCLNQQLHRMQWSLLLLLLFYCIRMNSNYQMLWKNQQLAYLCVLWVCSSTGTVSAFVFTLQALSLACEQLCKA